MTVYDMQEAIIARLESGPLAVYAPSDWGDASLSTGLIGGRTSCKLFHEVLEDLIGDEVVVTYDTIEGVTRYALTSNL